MPLRASQLRITLALILLGAAAGSLVATGILAAATIANNGLRWSDVGMSASIGCRLGVLFGAPMGPALGFNAFRHIPIGRALAAVTRWPLAGAVLGALLSIGTAGSAATRRHRAEGVPSLAQGCDTRPRTLCYADTARPGDADEDPMLSPIAAWIWFAAAGDSLEVSTSPEAFVYTSIGQERDSLQNTARRFRRRLQSDGVVLVWLAFDEQTADSVPYTLHVQHESAVSRPLRATGEAATLTVVSRHKNSTFSLVPASIAPTVRDRSQWRIFAKTYRVALVGDSLYELCRLPCSSPQIVKLKALANVVAKL